jgi:hypothetical protein
MTQIAQIEAGHFMRRLLRSYLRHLRHLRTALLLPVPTKMEKSRIRSARHGVAVTPALT